MMLLRWSSLLVLIACAGAPRPAPTPPAAPPPPSCDAHVISRAGPGKPW